MHSAKGQAYEPHKCPYSQHTNAQTNIRPRRFSQGKATIALPDMQTKFGRPLKLLALDASLKKTRPCKGTALAFSRAERQKVKWMQRAQPDASYCMPVGREGVADSGRTSKEQQAV